MSKKRIQLYMEGISQPRSFAWYSGTPHADILHTIRAVSQSNFQNLTVSPLV